MPTAQFDTREAMRKSFPEYTRTAEQIVLSNIWNRPGLSQRERSLITVATLVSNYRPTELRFHVARAMENGVTKAELEEVFLHLACYAGWPAAGSGIHAAMEVLETSP